MVARGNINLSINATSNLGNTTATLEAMRRGMASVRAETEKYYRSMARTGNDAGLNFDKAVNRADELRSAYSNIVEQSGMYAKSTKNITAETTRFNEALSKQKIRLGDIVGRNRLVRDAMKEQMALNKMMVTGWRRDATGKINADIWVPTELNLKNMTAMRRQIGYYNELLRSVSQGMVNWGKNTQWAGRQLTVGFSVPISIAAGLLGKLGASADAELVRIVKVYGDTESAFQTSNESLRKMAQETAKYIADQYGIAASETRNVMAELAATGLEGPELQKMTASTQRLSLLGEMSPEESLTLMRVLKEVYGFSSQELDKQVDYFNAIENATALTMQDITEGIPRIAGIMKATGTSIQEQTELLVAFKSAGIDVAEGANALKSINFKAVAATPTAANAFFRITGIEMQTLIDRANGEFIPMMLEIAEVMKNLDQQAKVDLVARVFGIHQGSRAITLLDQLAEQSEGLMRAHEVGLMSVAERAEMANSEIAAIQESASTRFKRMIEGIKASLEPLGVYVLETIIPLGEYITKFVNWINGWSDATKRFATVTALFLAVTGPLVMLAGLFGNLIGMFGRAVGWVVQLGFKFNILNTETHAATLIQKAFESETSNMIRTLEEERIALGNLAKALEDVNQSMREMHGLNRGGTGITRTGPVLGPDGKPVATMLALEPLPKKDPFVGTADGKTYTPQQYRQANMTRAEYQAAWDEAIIENNNRKVAEHNKLVAESRGRWMAVGTSIAAASAAIYGLGQMTDNQWISKLANAGMLIGSMSPLLGQVFSSYAKGMDKALTSSTGLFSTVGGKIKGLATTARNALTGLISFMTGPFGLAIAGAALVAFAAWDRHRKQMKEIREMYEGLTDSAELLGKTYDFQAVSRLNQAMAGGTYDPDTLMGQRARLEDMKESNKELYDLIQKRSEDIRKNYEGEARAREAANEAMRQGAQVLRQTGDRGLAKRVAWDTYNAISDEWRTFDDFEKDVMLRFNIDLDSLNSAADTAVEIFQGRLEQQGMKSNKTFMNLAGLNSNYLEQIKADTVSTYDAILAIENPMERHKKFEEAFASMREVQDIFFKAQKAGVIDADMTFAEFSTNMMKHLRDLEDANLLPDDSYEMVQVYQATAQAINGINPNILNAVSQSNMDIIESISGIGMMYREMLDQQKLSVLYQELSLAKSDEERESIEDEIRLIKERAWAEATGFDATEQAADGAKTAIEALNWVTSAGKTGVEAFGIAGTGAMNNIENAAVDAKSALESLTDPQRTQYDAYKSSMEYLQQQTVQVYRDEFQAIQDAERKAFDDAAQVRIDDIEAEYDAIEKEAEATAKRRERRLENIHDRQKAALEAEKEAAMEAMDDRREALKEQQDKEEESLKKRQERRRDQITATYDAQIEKINDQIEIEQKLEEQRQRMFEAEKERINRLRNLYSQNIDLNMAVNTGDLDEAARIASSMNASQEQWALDDLSKISAEGSETRQDRMRGQIDVLEAQKDERLKNLKEVEKAEEEALKKKYKLLEKELAEERKMLDKSFKQRSDNLTKRQRRQREALTDTLNAEREVRQTNRAEALANEKQETADKKVELDKRLDDTAASFNEIASHWEGMTAKNAQEWRSNNNQMLAEIEQVLGIKMRRIDEEEAKKLWSQRHRKQERELDRMANDRSWVDAARIIVDNITAGVFGYLFTASEMATFLKTGKLPKSRSKPARGTNYGRFNRTERSALHSGGIAGRDSSWTGPGFTGKHQEVDATLLKGEGVLNLRAMRTPGVPQLIDELNKGRGGKSPIANLATKKGNSSNRVGGAAGGFPIGTMVGMIAGIMNQVTRMLATTGMEVGMGKAEQMLSGVSIKLGKDQAIGLDAEQLSNAAAIISTGRRLSASDRDIITALMTAMQESSMRNIGYGDSIYGVRNPDGSLTSSLGLFQQQNWWGTRGERLDPSKSSELFYRALFRVSGRDQMPLTQAAQAVQRSAYPNAYAKWESLARVLLGGASTEGITVSSNKTMAQRLKDLRKRVVAYEEAQKGYMYPTTGMISWLYGWRNMSAMGRRDFHNGLDIRAPGGTPVYATAPGRVSTGWDSYGGGNYVRVDHGNGIGTGYYHLSRIVAKPGQQVQRGTYIGQVGNTGRLSFGNHLHFSAFKNGAFVDPAPFMAEKPYIGKYVRPNSIGMRAGGLVPGRGFGDIIPAMLEPGEFVVKKKAVDSNGALLAAINNGDLEMRGRAENIDNRRVASYNVKVNFNGPINKDVDIERAMNRVMTSIERRKAPVRRID